MSDAKGLRNFTGDLPADVVAQPLTIAVWVTDIEGQVGETGRPVGRHMVGITLGDRQNPELTDPERAYVIAAMHYAAWKVAGRPTTERPGPPGLTWDDLPDRIAPWPDAEMA